jgi:hypothetical protein
MHTYRAFCLIREGGKRMIKKTIMLLFITFKVFAFDINPGISGSWFDQNNSGQGFNIEILSSNRLLVYWYAYDQGAPIWLTGVGTYQGNNATISLDQFDGSNFGVNHQSRLVNSTPFGSLSLTFNNCNLGVADYTSSSGFGSGSIKLNRLTDISGLTCSDESKVNTPNTVPANEIDFCMRNSNEEGCRLLNATEGIRTEFILNSTCRSSFPELNDQLVGQSAESCEFNSRFAGDCGACGVFHINNKITKIRE